MSNKDIVLNVDINTQDQLNFDTKQVWRSYDHDAAHLVLNLTKNGEKLSVETVQTVRVLITSLNPYGGVSKELAYQIDLPIDADSTASHTLPLNVIQYVGRIGVHVYVLFNDGSSNDAGQAFVIELRRSAIDKTAEYVGQYYCTSFEQMLADVKAKADSVSDEINHAIDWIGQAQENLETIAQDAVKDYVASEVAELDSTKADKTALANTNQQVNSLEATKMDKNTTDIGISQINKNKGKIDQTYLTDSLLQQMAGTASINAVPANGSLTTAKYADKSVTLNKVARNLAFPTVGLGNGVPNYDTATKTLTFNAGNSFDTISWGDSVNRINLPQTGTQVSHNFGGHTIKLIINVDTEALSFIAYSTVLKDNESCLMTMEYSGKTVSASFPITVNGKLPVPPSQLSRIGYLPTKNNLPVKIDAESCKMYFDGYDNWLFYAYDTFKTAIPYGGLELSIPTQEEISTTAIYLLFDTVSGEYEWSAYNSNINYSPDFAIVGFVRRSNDSYGRLTSFNADFPFPWTFQGRLYGLDAADAGYTKSYREKVTNEIKCILHRGWNKRTPENTLRAYKEAKKRGFDMVECDISWTSDNEPVLLHDLTINRTARNDDGTTIADITNIADITLEQAKTYDFGIWQGAEFKGERIPTFREFLILCKQLDMYPYIEIKTVATTEQIQILADTVTDVGLTNFAWISGITQITMMSALRPDDDFGWVTTLTDIPDSDLALWAAFKTSKNRVFIDGELTKMSSVLVTKIKNAGLEAEGWSAQTTAQVRQFLDYGLTGISTDNVSVIESLVE